MAGGMPRIITSARGSVTIRAMTLRIYGIPRSRTFRPLWAAEELGIPYENIPVDFTEGVKKPEFLAVNPAARIPAIEDGGFRLSESLAITTYLVKRHGGPLKPATLEDEARMLQWTLWGVADIERALIDLVMNRHVLPPEKRNAELAQASEEKLVRPLALLDAQLAKSPYLLGEAFTLADLNVASLLYSAWFNKVDLGRWPHVKAWLDRCLTRPGALRARKLRE
jgi:glutathione S-transferase